MNDLIILIDMDDTLEDLLSPWVGELNRRFSTDVKVTDISDWDMSLFFDNRSREEIYAPLLERDFWGAVEPKCGAVEYTQKLKDEGYELHVCTSSGSPIVGHKIEIALLSHFPHFSWDDVIITKNKSLIRGDILIDDCPANFAGGNYKGILMDAPHNQKFDSELSKIPRAKTWSEIYEQVHRITDEIITKKYKNEMRCRYAKITN